MHSELYAFVVDCFKYMEAHDTSNADCDQQCVLTVVEEDRFGDVFGVMHDFDGWTFDTCSPFQLRFSQRGTSTPDSPTDAPMWKCLVVDLLDEGVVVIDDPLECTVMFSMSNPEYRLLMRNIGVIATQKMRTCVCLWSVYHYSEIRKKITTEATGLPDALGSLCESFFFCPGCWRGASTVYNIPNPQIESESRFECGTPCEFCAQFSGRIEGESPQELDVYTDEESDN